MTRDYWNMNSAQFSQIVFTARLRKVQKATLTDCMSLNLQL